MKAIIMAGGEGSRLRPLTCDCPKPMVPVMDKPVMEYALMLLKQHGITEVGATLAYLPEHITNFFGDGEGFDVNLHYYVEEHPLGTAGSVKQAEAFLDETFVVLSGDGLTDCDLSAAYEFHKKSGALATMVLKKLDQPLEYGVVVTDQDGRVQRFVEKPGWGEVYSDTVNTGIYILEPEVLGRIPSGKAYDFGRELFPALVEQNEKVFGYQMDGYWCDIGDLSAYLKAHMDAMDGRVRLISAGQKGSVIRMPGADIDRGAVLEGPCFIGCGARISEGSRIGPYSVIGSGSFIGALSSVKRAVIWRGARVGEKAQLRGCVVQNGAMAGESCSMFEESVLADTAMLGEGAVMMPGVKVWPKKRVLPGERLDRNLIWGAHAQQRYEGGILRLNSPIDAVIGAQGYASAIKPGIVLIGRDASVEALSYARAASASLMAQGVQMIDIGAVTLPQLRHAMRTMGGDGALYLTRDALHPLGKHGLKLIKVQQRRLRDALLREEHISPFSQGAHPPIQAMRTDLSYINMLMESIDQHMLKDRMPRVALFSEDQMLLTLAERVMMRSGIWVRAEWEREMMELDEGEIGIWLSEHGERANFSDAEGMLSEPEREMLMAWTALEDGARQLMVQIGETQGIAKLAEHYGVDVRMVKSDPAELQAQLLGVDEAQLMLRFDGLYAAMQVLEQLTKRGLTLRGVQRSMPQIHRHTRKVSVELKDKGALLKGLSGMHPNADTTDGIRLNDERGWAWISPAGDRRECLVVTESFDAEIAKELCDFYSAELGDLLHGKNSSRE